MYEPDGDDLRGPIEGRKRLGHNYLVAIVPAVLVLAVVGAGLAGRQLGGQPAAPTPLPTAAASVLPTAPARAIEPTIAPSAGDTSIAAVGNHVFYTVGSRRIESLVPGGDGVPATVVNAAPCEEIGQLAAAGETLVYVTTKRGTPTVDSCVSTALIEWTIWAFDVPSGVRHRLAAGMRLVTERNPLPYAVHVAVGDGMYAFDRPTDDSVTGSAMTLDIEVRSLADNSPVWRTTVGNDVQALMLGGNRLSIVTTGWGVQQLFIGDSANGRLDLISSQSQGGSLSRDGRYLLWDAGEPAPMRTYSTLNLTDLGTGEVRNLGLSVGAPGPPSIDPAVSETAYGPVAAWFAPLPAGGIAIRFVDPGHPNGSWLPLDVLPVWMSVQGETLVWLTQAADGAAAARSVDLAAVR